MTLFVCFINIFISVSTRVVQKLIETLKTSLEISLVISALEPGFLALVKDLNGNHVVQRCLQCLSIENNKVKSFIFLNCQCLHDIILNICVLHLVGHEFICCCMPDLSISAKLLMNFWSEMIINHHAHLSTIKSRFPYHRITLFPLQTSNFVISTWLGHAYYTCLTIFVWPFFYYCPNCFEFNSIESLLPYCVLMFIFLFQNGCGVNVFNAFDVRFCLESLVSLYLLVGWALFFQIF